MPRIFEAPLGFVLNPDYLVPELRAQRDALLAALCELLADAEFLGWDTTKARAAIRAVEEGK